MFEDCRLKLCCILSREFGLCRHKVVCRTIKHKSSSVFGFGVLTRIVMLNLVGVLVMSAENTPISYDLFSLCVFLWKCVGISHMHYADISLDIAATFQYYSVISMETELHMCRG